MQQNAVCEDSLTLVRRNARFIGGGTCCGKSTIASLIGQRHGWSVFSADDNFEKYVEATAFDISRGQPQGKVDFEYIWMRDPVIQFDEMLRFYREIFPHVLADVAALCEAADGKIVIAEGIAILPELLAGIGIQKSRCAFLMMEKTVHDERYAQRDWTPLLLEGCADPKRAFELWMQRDELFCEHVRRECDAQGFLRIESNSDTDIETVLQAVESLWTSAE